MTVVSVVRAGLSDLQTNLKRALDAICYVPSGRPFFIKPNLVRPAPPARGITTHPALVEAFISLYPDGEFVIGDGTPSPRDYARALKASGFAALARRHQNVRLVNLDCVEREEVQCGEMTLRLPTLLRTHEYVNVAKMKTHSQTFVSLAVKNQKGLLSLADKKRFHRLGLHEPVKKLGECVRASLNIIEGIVALEGNGPSFFGKAKPFGVIIAGADAFAADAVGCRVMGLPVRSAKHLKADVEYEVVGDGIDAARSRFIPPRGNWSVGRMRIFFDERCCSICLSNLPDVRRKIMSRPLTLARFIYHAIRGDVALVAGGSVPAEARKKRVIFLGDCGRRCAEAAGMADGARVAGGCPFDADEFLKVF